jgi:hypothetical protein
MLSFFHTYKHIQSWVFPFFQTSWAFFSSSFSLFPIRPYILLTFVILSHRNGSILPNFLTFYLSLYDSRFLPLCLPPSRMVTTSVTRTCYLQIIYTLLFMASFYDAGVVSQYTAQDGRKIRACWFGKGQGGSGRCVIGSASRKVPAETVENHKPSLRAAYVIGREETEDSKRRHKPYDIGPPVRYKYLFL